MALNIPFAVMAVLSFTSTLCIAQSTDFGADAPSSSSIIDALKKEPSAASQENGVTGVRTRSFKGISQAPVSENGTGQPAENTAQKKSVTMQIQFDSGSSHIASSSRKAVNALAEALKSDELKEQKFIIVGHTDSVGSAAFNKRLSLRRAMAVKEYLVKQGAPAAHLKTAGKGFSELKNKENPQAPENRRVEIIAAE